MAAGKYDGEVRIIRAAVWAENSADVLKANPYRPTAEIDKPVELTLEQSARLHAENVALLRAMGPR